MKRELTTNEGNPMPVTFDDVKIGRIFIDLNNPRHEPYASEPQAVEYLCRQEGVFPLARDIRRHGLNPLERVALIPIKARGEKITGYVMAEGNRRLCALKLLDDPEKAPADLRKSFQDLARGWTPITSLPAVIFENMEAARLWLERIHSGYQGGVGRRDWTADQQQRFSGRTKNRAALSFLDYAEHEGMITPEQRKGKLTTVQRFIGNDVFRETLGIDQSDYEQLQRTRPKKSSIF